MNTIRREIHATATKLWYERDNNEREYIWLVTFVDEEAEDEEDREQSLGTGRKHVEGWCDLLLEHPTVITDKQQALIIALKLILREVYWRLLPCKWHIEIGPDKEYKDVFKEGT